VETPRLAVYGTLAPGRANHWKLAPLRGVWFTGTIRGRRLAAGWGNDHGFPGVQLAADGEEIPVDVFECADLPGHWNDLDAFEGDEYERVVTDVATADGPRSAHIYVIGGSSKHAP
jgi:gamma-glutamylcyclotransferase (GGCT)/AIG2-like uncharacterized protein YtfP